jgi:hypothetical protein
VRLELTDLYVDYMVLTCVSLKYNGAHVERTCQPVYNARGRYLHSIRTEIKVDITVYTAHGPVVDTHSNWRLEQATGYPQNARRNGSGLSAGAGPREGSDTFGVQQYVQCPHTANVESICARLPFPDAATALVPLLPLRCHYAFIWLQSKAC